MADENSLAYYFTEIITTIKSFIVESKWLDGDKRQKAYILNPFYDRNIFFTAVNPTLV